jgi:hypothetical protein
MAALLKLDETVCKNKSTNFRARFEAIYLAVYNK